MNFIKENYKDEATLKKQQSAKPDASKKFAVRQPIKKATTTTHQNQKPT